MGTIVGGILGGEVGKRMGRELSPNTASDKLNQNLGAVTGEFLWEEHPENKSAQTLLRPGEKARTKIKLLRPKNLKRIKLETKLPPFLKGKEKEANVLIYEIESYEEETEDGRKIIHAPHKAYEYVLD